MTKTFRKTQNIYQNIFPQGFPVQSYLLAWDAACYRIAYVKTTLSKSTYLLYIHMKAQGWQHSLLPELSLPQVETDKSNKCAFVHCNIIPTDSTAHKPVMHLTKHVTISKALMLKLFPDQKTYVMNSSLLDYTKLKDKMHASTFRPIIPYSARIGRGCKTRRTIYKKVVKWVEIQHCLKERDRKPVVSGFGWIH